MWDSIKKRFKSKTHLFNSVAGLLLIMEQNMQVIRPALGDSTFAYLAFGLIVGNYILREVTKQPIAEK